MTRPRGILIAAAAGALFVSSGAAWGQAESPAAEAAPEPTARESAAGEAPEAEAAAEAIAPTAVGRVERAVFTTAVVEREPVGAIDSLPNDQPRVIFFTELRDLEGQRVVHRWEREGQVMAEVAFEVNGPRWRVYSTKNLQSEWTGEWTVSVIDQVGNSLATERFRYLAAEEASPPAAPASGAP